MKLKFNTKENMKAYGIYVYVYNEPKIIEYIIMCRCSKQITILRAVGHKSLRIAFNIVSASTAMKLKVKYLKCYTDS